MNPKIITATHRSYRMPENPLYFPLQVGAAGKPSIGFDRDDTGDNISSRNPSYCELTGLYWAWKNIDADYYGLDHYRRHFKGSQNAKDPFDQVLTEKEAIELLKTTDILLPKKRNYVIESIYSHYTHTHYGKDLDETRNVLNELYPEYLPAFDMHMKSASGHMFNMFLMKRELADQYCQFLFEVLFELEKRIDITSYDDFQKRVFGRISEMLLDVWILTNNLDYAELPMVSMERVNWLKKGTSFLKAKFLHKRYEASF